MFGRRSLKSTTPKKLRLLFVSMHYTPEPCDTRTSQLAAAMAERGHTATALTSFPNYPFGKIYPGYRQRPFSRSQMNGVDVVRVPMFPDHSRSKKRRALSYLSFGFSASVLGSFLCRRPDAIWIHHPPLTTGIAGYLLAKVKRVPFVYEIHDLWPETLVSSGMISDGRVTEAIRKVCLFLHKRAAALVVTSEGMKSNLVADGVPEDKIHVFPQWANEEVYRPTHRNSEFGLQHGLAGKFNVMYAGNLGIAQNLDTVLDAAVRLRDFASIQFVMVGDGVDGERLRARARDEGLTNVRFLGQHPAETMPRFMAWGDAMLVHLRRDPLFEITIPSKTQVYMAAGRPILCGVEGDGARVVRNAAAGLTFEPGNAAALSDAVLEMFRMEVRDRESLGINARAAYESRFSKRSLCGRYEELFHSILGWTQRVEVLAEALASVETSDAEVEAG